MLKHGEVQMHKILSNDLVSVVLKYEDANNEESKSSKSMNYFNFDSFNFNERDEGN